MTPLLTLAALATAFTQPPPVVRLPAEVTAVPGRIVRLAADTPGKVVRWALASDAADLVPFPDGKIALFSSPTPGRYLVLAWTAAGDVPGEAARCVVVVGDPPPGPPVPPPPPADPLTADLRKLFAADPSPDKAAHLAQLSALYREAVAFADRAEVETAGELAARIRSAAASLLPKDALPAVRKRVADEIARHLPLDGEQPLDAALRQAAADLFARLAAALEAARKA
jgi:hypothetical protein